MVRLAEVVTQTFRTFSPDALSERLFKDPLEHWWQAYQQKLEDSGYDGDVQGAFFIASFSVMGHVARIDGRIKEVEIELATKVMDHLKLSAEQRRLAIRLFNEGKHQDFSLDTLLWRFNRQCKHRVSVFQAFVEVQIKMAYADGSFNAAETKVIKRLCKRLNINDSIYIRIERRVRAEKKVHKQPLANSSKKTFSLADAYKILDINRWANQDQIKQAYRRMMNQFHPDKLMSRGASEVEVIEAHDVIQDIKNAYQMLVKR